MLHNNMSSKDLQQTYENCLGIASAAASRAPLTNRSQQQSRPLVRPCSEITGGSSNGHSIAGKSRPLDVGKTTAESRILRGLVLELFRGEHTSARERIASLAGMTNKRESYRTTCNILRRKGLIGADRHNLWLTDAGTQKARSLLPPHDRSNNNQQGPTETQAFVVDQAPLHCNWPQQQHLPCSAVCHQTDHQAEAEAKRKRKRAEEAALERQRLVAFAARRAPLENNGSPSVSKEDIMLPFSELNRKRKPCKYNCGQPASGGFHGKACDRCYNLRRKERYAAEKQEEELALERERRARAEADTG